jgi:hypothetical protein
MNGKADPRPDMDIIITQDDVERFLTRVEHLQEPCDLGAINCTVHSHKAVMVEGPVS